MKNKLVPFIALALFCLAATTPPSPLELMGIINSDTIKTNVPVHVLPVVQQAQDTLSQYLVMIIPVVVPILIAGLKKWIPNIPSWILPVLAPLLGALADLIMQAAGVQTGGAVKGALLGSAGVGLRELQNQVAQAMPKPPPTPPAVVPPPPTPKP